VSGKRKLKRRSPESTSRRVVRSPAPGVTHVADATPGGVHAPRSTPSQSAASTTTRLLPVSGSNTSVTTWSVPVARNPLEASHDRSFISSRSPGAAYGRFVAPSAALKLFSVPGIRLHAACSGRAPPTTAARISARTAPHRVAAGIACVSGWASVVMAAGSATAAHGTSPLYLGKSFTKSGMRCARANAGVRAARTGCSAAIPDGCVLPPVLGTGRRCAPPVC
jgi:hypothetical protein